MKPKVSGLFLWSVKIEHATGHTHLWITSRLGSIQAAINNTLTFLGSSKGQAQYPGVKILSVKEEGTLDA